MFTLLKTIIVFAVAIYLLAVLALYFFQRNMMYYPPKMIDAVSAARLQNFHKQTVTTDDGVELTGYYLPPSTPNAPVIMLFHGNASHPAWVAGKLDLLVRQLGAGAILVEYRGYGDNAGKPTQQGLFADARAWAGWWQKQAEATTHPIVYYGESLGSGIAVYLATIHPPDALILETPYDSILNVAKHHYRFVPAMDAILHDHYRSDELIGQLEMPKLFLLAGRDKIVPPASSVRLFDLAQEPKTRVDFPEATHIDIFNYGGDEAILEFLLHLTTGSSGHA